MKLYDNFTNKYQLSKTIRFKLIPQGSTLENIQKNGVLNEDKNLADIYEDVKEVMDEFHKKFIDEALSNLTLKNLENYEWLYNITNKTEGQIKEFNKCKLELRKEVVNKLIKSDKFNSLFSQDFIREILPDYVCGDKDKVEKINRFKNFTTFFKGYNLNRENLYKVEEKSTAIAYRLIQENLVKFLDNSKSFKRIKEVLISKNSKVIEKELADILKGDRLEDVFVLEYFNKTLTQKGIDRYNQVIGGYNLEKGIQIKGLNQYVNEYNQDVDKVEKLPKLKPLFKQILSEKTTASFIPTAFKGDEEVLEAIEKFNIQLETEVFKPNEGRGLRELITDIRSYDLSKIYIRNDVAITNISQALYGDWGMINRAVEVYYDTTYQGKKKKNTKVYEDEREKYIKGIESYSIDYLNMCIRSLDRAELEPIENLFLKFSCKDNDIEGDYYYIICHKYKEFLSLKNKAKEKLVKDEKRVEHLKSYLDSVKELQRFIKPLLGKGNEPYKDERFYGELIGLWSTIDNITGLYNKVRNYVTSKPYSEDKIKLNFGNPDLLGGWPVGREIATSGVIFKDEKFYYLGIMDKDSKKEFKDYPKPLNKEDVILKMKYLQAADPQKDVQNLMVIDGKTEKKNGRKEKSGEYAGENLQLEQFKNTYLPSDINEIRLKRSYSKMSEEFNNADLNKFISYYVERVKEYYDAFDFKFKEPNEYRDFGDFTNHVNEQAYQIGFQEISRSHLDDLVARGKLYLFKIYNKDFSEYSKGKPNLHTLYWNMVFDERNFNKVIYKLNGEAEVFYRKASIPKEITHPANELLTNKNLLNKKITSKFGYDLIKDKRYSEDQFQLHVPITLNFTSERNERLNEEVNRTIKDIEDINVIGIDRGERNLLYITVIDKNGDIVNGEQHSLNKIINTHNNQDYVTDYRMLLDKREKERDLARKSWKSIESIKDLKDGYLSQVINKIVQLMIKYNAIVVLEDLNFGFMRGRQKFEKQVYQKFEKMLIDKLNYLVDKNEDVTKPGGLLKAYQLTNKFESFEKLGKQSGVLYYVPAWNTSKIDPTTGFVNMLQIKYENIESSKLFIGKFDDIRFNSEDQYFEFDVEYSRFTNKAEGSRSDWTLCSRGTRVLSFRNPEENNKWDSRELELTKEFVSLFNKYEVDYKDKNLKAIIIQQEKKEFFEELFKLIKLMVQMRNSKSGTYIDYMISPVKNHKGKFYDSRYAEEGLPKDADANGAYNIARKGLWIIEEIKRASDENLGRVKMAISNKEWLSYAQKNVK